MKSIQLVIILLVVGGVCVALSFFLPAFTEYRQKETRIKELRLNIQAQNEEIRRLKQEIEALRTDPRAVERVARESFGMCKEGEEIYVLGGQSQAAVPPPQPPSGKKTSGR